MNKIKLPGLKLFLLSILGAVMLSSAQAKCARTSYSWGYQKNVQVSFGRLNLTNTTLQPVGASLGAITVNAGQSPLFNSETVLWECDPEDKDQLYEGFATAGWEQYAGYTDAGSRDGMPGFYQTWFPFVGVKFTHVNSGKVLTRYWQYAKLTNYDVDDVRKKILIKAKHLSPLQAEVARISSNTTSGAPYNVCGSQASLQQDSVYYWCGASQAFIVFKGPGYESASDPEGSDSATNYNFWYARNGVPFSMRWGSALSYAPTCVVKNTTPSVRFDTITRQELQNGDKRQANFSIEFMCDRKVSPGTNNNQTAFGVLPSVPARSAAARLGLKNATGGMRYLLSDNYGLPGVATGVGIQISDANTGQPMNFLGDERSGSNLWDTFGYRFAYPSGNGAGWYPVFNGNPSPGESDTFSHTRVISATLEKIPGLDVVAGKVDATAQIIVKVQ